MKTLIISRYVYFLTLVLLAFLVSCSVPVIETASLTDTPVFLTSTPSPTMVPQPTPSPALPTDIPTPSPISPTRTPRPRRAPPLTADEEQALVLELLQDNGGCRLPCWWGFTPGVTAWYTADTFFASLGKRVQMYRNSQMTNYSVDFDIPQHDLQICQDYFVTDDTIDIISIHAVPPERDEEFVYGDAQFAEDLESYMLPQLLAVYGQPPQVFLKTYSNAPDRLPFSLLLLYPDRGILVKYNGPIGEEGKHYGPIEEGEMIRICPWRAEINLWLWSPDNAMTIDRVTGGYIDMDDYRSLEEATGMRIKEFYQTFSQPDNQTCLETPADLW